MFNTTKELVKKGHNVAVYTSDMLDLTSSRRLTQKNLTINGVSVFYLRSILHHKTFIVTPSIFNLLKKSILDFDLIHIHDCRSYQGINTCLFAQKMGVPYVFQSHGSFLDPSPSSLVNKVGRLTIDRLFSEKIVKSSSKIIALNKTEANEYIKFGIPLKRIEIIPNGIDLLEYTRLPQKGEFKEKFNIEKEKKIILYLGRIHKTKGIDLLIKSYFYLIREKKDCNSILVIAGPDDGYLLEAENLVYTLGLSQFVLFTGYLTNEDKIKALVDAEIFITPSFYGFPITFLEACAIGVPIVTTTSGDILDWINDKVGFVTKPIPSVMALAMYKILSDNELSEKLSRNCKTILKSEFTLEKVVDKLERVYYEVLQQN